MEDTNARLGNLYSDGNKFLLNASCNWHHILFSFYPKFECAITDDDGKGTGFFPGGLVQEFSLHPDMSAQRPQLKKQFKYKDRLP